MLAVIGVFIVVGLYVLYEVYRWRKHEKKMEEVEYFTPSSYISDVIETNNPYIKCKNNHPVVHYRIDEEIGWVKCEYCYSKYVYKWDWKNV